MTIKARQAAGPVSFFESYFQFLMCCFFRSDSSALLLQFRFFSLLYFLPLFFLRFISIVNHAPMAKAAVSIRTA